MNRKLVITMVIIASIAMTAGMVKAAGVTADWLRVGIQGEGGVTYFNGTIINETTDDNDADNPVTFGDNVRIDGRVYRGATAGTSDSLPFIVNDNMEVTGTLTVAGLSGIGIVSSDNITDSVIATADLADSAITSAKIFDGTIAAGDLAGDSVTSAKIADSAIAATDIAAGAVTQTGEANSTDESTQTTVANLPNFDAINAEVDLTTGDSTALVMFSGVFAVNADNSSCRAILLVDDEAVAHTTRRGTSNTTGEVFNLTFTALINVSAGDHTFKVGWNTDVGTTASLYNHTLDVVELKK